MRLTDIAAWAGPIIAVGAIISWVVLFWRRFGRIEQGIHHALEAIASMSTSFATFVKKSRTKGKLSKKDWEEIAAPFYRAPTESILNLLKQIKPVGNPVSASELEEVRQYVSKADQGGSLSAHERSRLYILSQRLNKEREANPAEAIILTGIVAFLLGLAIGSEKGTRWRSAFTQYSR